MLVHHDIAPPTQVSTRWRPVVAVLLVVGSLLWIAEELLTSHKELSITAGIVSVPFQAAYVLIMVGLTRPWTRWAVPSGIVFGLSLVGLSVVHGMEYAEFVQVQAGADKEALGRVLESTSTLPAIIVLSMFFGGALIGSVMWVVTLWRSSWVPRGAVALMAGELVLDLLLDLNVAGLIAGAASTVWIALTVMRTGAPNPRPESTMVLP